MVDIDLERGTLTVRWELIQIEGTHACPHCHAAHKGMLFSKPKTAASEDATVELDSGTVGVLLEWRLRQDLEPRPLGRRIQQPCSCLRP